jgi:hypothetical protein
MYWSTTPFYSYAKDMPDKGTGVCAMSVLNELNKEKKQTEK